MITDKERYRTVIHLEFQGKHFYYGSLACIFEFFTSDQLGISYGSLRNFGVSEAKPYVNEKCIIRKGKLVTKEKNNT